MISFSTCWNSRRHTSGDAMLGEVKTKLGFDLIELDHGIRMPLMSGIQKMSDTREIRFSSLHNFCLLSGEATVVPPDCYKFSAASAEERERAVTQTFHAIDLAGQLNAPFVVLNLGQVNMPPITDRLIAMAKAGEYLSRNYVKLKIKAVHKRELAILLDEMNSPQLGYWHDFGHSQIKENLGFIDHAEWLRTVGPRTFGCHVHDCIWPARE